LGGGGRRFGLNRQYSGRGCKAVEEGVDGKNEKAVRKPKEHAERDPKNKPKPVWLQVGNPKGPYLFKFFQRVDTLAIVTL
jgi:hypothetical protein